MQIGHALPQQPQANQDGETVSHIVVLKEGLNEDHLNKHLNAVKGVRKRSKRDDNGETGVKHVINGASYSFQGYTRVFTPETLEYIKAHEHVDYVQEDVNLPEPPVKGREVSDADLAVEDEDADTDATTNAPGSAGGGNRQKYSTLLAKGLRLDVVVPLTKNAKRNNPAVLSKTNPATVLNETNPAVTFNFTAPSADMTGIVNLKEYFAEPDPDTIFNNIPNVPEAPEEGAEANRKRAVVDIPGCTGKINTHFKLAEDYNSYMHALDVSYRRGGKLIARLIFRAKDKRNTKDVKAHAEAALRFWGVSGDVSVSVKDSMEQVDKHAHVDITMFQEGNLGTFMTGTDGAVSSEKSSLGSASGSFKQVKEWADEFMRQACNHNFAYRPVLEEYTTLPGFPADQTVHDYGVIRIISNRILRELVKLSELVTTITTLLQSKEGWEEHIDDMNFEFLDVVSASKEWVEKAAADTSTARWNAKQLMIKFRLFNRTYKKYLKSFEPKPVE
ncbi:hypothetical protein ARSEF4850_009076 [Beauveria asiatica]